MDKQTLSHYGWIVVWVLTISVILVFATPFGRYVGVAAKNVIVAFGDVNDKSIDDIPEEKEKTDTDLNGLFIVTSKQGNEKCYVFGVNDTYDAYSLVTSGKAPVVNDKYFRCTRYVDIEERRDVKEMFYLSHILGLDDTTEERQGIQCALLHYVNGGDYSDYATSISSTARNVYDTLLSNYNTIKPDKYENLKLIAIEKDDYIDMIILKPDGVAENKTEYIITERNDDPLQLRLNDMVVYCVERYSPMPEVGIVYNKIDSFECPETLKNVAIAITELDDGTNEFRTASQYAVWQCYEPETPMWVLAQAKFNEKVTTLLNEILAYTPDKDYNVSTQFYDTSGYQAVCHFDVIPSVVEEPAFTENIIPEGGTVVLNGVTYNAGAAFPVNQSNMQFLYGDYKYTYNNGWGVRVQDTNKTSYGEILENINGSPVIDMTYAFANCGNLTTAPAIPNTIVKTSCAYLNCTSLTTAPIIPDGLTDMIGTFMGCTSLEVAPTIPNGVTDMRSTFEGCTSLTTAPTIPSGVTRMCATFEGCTSLTTAPVIPESVTSIASAFKNCIFLTGIVEINAELPLSSGYAGCFDGTAEPITLTGTSPCLDTIASKYDNVSIYEEETTVSETN